MEEKILKRLADKEFTEKFLTARTREKARAAFTDEGIEISQCQVDELGERINKILKELSLFSEDDIDIISGGLDLISQIETEDIPVVRSLVSIRNDVFRSLTKTKDFWFSAEIYK